jgi:hypothetical protein
MWSTQHVIATFGALSTLKLKCLKILHLFLSESNAFFVTTLPLFMLESYFILFTSIRFIVFHFLLQICSNWVSWIINDIGVDLTPLTIRTCFCKISQSLNHSYKLDTLNWLLSWTPRGCLAHTFQNCLSTPHTLQNNNEEFFLFKKSLWMSVTFYLEDVLEQCGYRQLIHICLTNLLIIGILKSSTSIDSLLDC